MKWLCMANAIALMFVYLSGGKDTALTASVIFVAAAFVIVALEKPEGHEQ